MFTWYIVFRVRVYLYKRMARLKRRKKQASTHISSQYFLFCILSYLEQSVLFPAYRMKVKNFLAIFLYYVQVYIQLFECMCVCECLCALGLVYELLLNLTIFHRRKIFLQNIIAISKQV